MIKIPLKTINSVALNTVFMGVCVLAGTNLQAQSVYRIVGPDGKVTFSDKPPPPSATPPKITLGRPGSASAESNSGLPYELRSIVQRYPVVLYTGKDCAPCGSGRNMLRARGIPFSERTIESNDDIAALQRITGNTSLPALSIGSQQLQGYSDSEWAQYLDAAGYPKTSQLPANYRASPAQALVARTQADAAPVPAPRAPAAAPEPATPSSQAPVGNNPTGIKF